MTDKDKKGLLSPPRPLWRYLGYSLVVCWGFTLYTFRSAHSGLAYGSFDLVCTAAMAAAALLVLFLSPRLGPLCKARAADAVAALLGVMGGLLCLGLVPGVGEEAANVAGAAMVGASTAYVSLAWQEYFTTRGARPALLVLAADSLIGTLLFFVLLALPHGAPELYNVVAPVAAVVLLRPQPGTRFFASNQFSSARALCQAIVHDYSPRLMWLMCLVSCALGLMRTAVIHSGEAPVSNEVVVLVLNMSVAAVIAMSAVVFMRDIDFIKIFHVCVVGSAVAVLVAAYAQGLPLDLSVFLLSCADSFVMLIAWLALVERASVKRTPAIGLLASLYAANQVGLLVGQALALQAKAGRILASQAALLVLVLAALMIASLKGRLVTSKASRAAGASAASVRDWAASLSLTPRETEVLELWAAGHTSPFIEERLGISHSTVRTHLKHIYQKTGTSNREELLSMVEGR